jgi:hypothetical protein
MALVQTPNNNIRAIEVPYNLCLHYEENEIAPEMQALELPFQTARNPTFIPNWYETDFAGSENLWRPGDPDMFELFDMCPNLQHLTIEVGYDKSLSALFSGIFIFSTRTLAESLGLPRILRLPSLRSLTLRINMCAWDQNMGYWEGKLGEKRALVKQLEGWLKIHSRSGFDMIVYFV